MDLSRIVTMVVNILLRKAITRGVDAGIDYVAGRGKAADEQATSDPALTAEANAAAKRARQTANLARRLGK